MKFRAVVCAGLLSGCVRSTVDNLTTQRIVPAAARVADVDRTCRTGGALGHALNGVTHKTPHRAMIIADATAALCDEAAANEASLDALRARRGPDSVAAVKDIKERERRLRARAAGRFYAAWLHAEAEFGPLGEACPTVRSKDELTLLVGLLSGTLAMLHDKASGSTHGVPLDTLNRVGRVASCLEGWWQVPVSFEAAGWATIPGTGPEGVDPWAKLLQAAEDGGDTGVRLGWAVLAVIGDNAGREDQVEIALAGATKSFAATAPDPDFRLFDQYAHDLLQVQADRRWIAARGHRVQGLQLPEPVLSLPEPTIDLFADDPFSEDEP